MKKYFEFEVIETELTANDPTNQKMLYPHDGTFVVIRSDGTKSVVWVVRGNTNNDYCQQFQETFFSGEWVSGKTLSEIIKTLVTKQ